MPFSSAQNKSGGDAGHSPCVWVNLLQREPGPDDLRGLRLALADAKGISLRQDFPGGNREAAPTGTVWTGWTGPVLHILAELRGGAIRTRAEKFNQMIYLLGDCLEIFLKAPEGSAYLEFHIAPNNMVLQLLFPSSSEFERCRNWPEAEFIARFALPQPSFVSRVWSEPGEGRWTVFASIDLRLLVPSMTTLSGRRLQFHFGRYDYPADGQAPILSCSSVLSRLDFHAISEWGHLIMTGDA